MTKEDFNWTEQPIIGTALLIMGGSIDSNNQPIKSNVHYNVGKHKSTGKVIISPIQ